MAYVEIQSIEDGLNKQALAVLAMLRDGEISIPGVGTNEYPLSTFTSTWYNCRERGVCITVSPALFTSEIVITFGEVRNSDAIFVDSWVWNGDLNPPTLKTFGDEAYENRVCFNHGEAGKAAQYIRDLIEQHVRVHFEQKELEPA